jgi:hypothetical protein
MSREEELLGQIEEMRQDRREADIQWRLGISETLREVCAKVEEVHSYQRDMHAKLTITTEILTGNGTPEKGLVVRLDRVEQNHATQSRWFWVIIPATLTGLASAVWNYFKSP